VCSYNSSSHRDIRESLACQSYLCLRTSSINLDVALGSQQAAEFQNGLVDAILCLVVGYILVYVELLHFGSRLEIDGMIMLNSE
jgi:hypothetical protein